MSEEIKAACLDATCQCKKSQCCKAPGIKKLSKPVSPEDSEMNEDEKKEIEEFNSIADGTLICEDCESVFVGLHCKSAAEIKKDFDENLRKIRAGKIADDEEGGDDTEDSE